MAEAAESEARVSELEGKVASLESENREAVARMEEALSKESAAEEKADKAVKTEEETRAEMAVSGLVCEPCVRFHSFSVCCHTRRMAIQSGMHCFTPYLSLYFRRQQLLYSMTGWPSGSDLFLSIPFYPFPPPSGPLHPTPLRRL